MATSNRDRIGRMFEIMSPALDSFITSTVAPAIGDQDWTDLFKLADKDKGIDGKKYDRSDPQVQLRMLTENITGRVKSGWVPFRSVLTRQHEAYASELRAVRDQWAHLQSFDDDTAYRSLDTARLLLGVVGATTAADDVDRIRLELRRMTANKQDKKSLKAATVVPDAAGLVPWRNVLRPRDEVATGNFQSSEFAADLYKVARRDNTLGGEYSDPAEFFARTYLTEGLRDLLGRAVARLNSDTNASPVINLQTNFGGGKTHSMLALWHLASGLPLGSFPQETQELLSESGYPTEGFTSRRVALVGNHFAPQGETKSDGTRVNTLWGELAWQLGGVEAFAIVAEHDAKGTNPGADLHRLLDEYSPAVILIDEWVAYARQLYGREDLRGGTFDTQFTFAQSLTEAAKSTPGVLLAISIPASHDGDDSQGPIAGTAEEVGASNGLEAVKRLQNVVRRVADQWRPASSDEAYRIVKQRLFQAEDSDLLAQINVTAKAFVDFYRQNAGEFPRESLDPDYERRIKQSYPLHPELLDRLYEDWSSLERFQRTRGVLRLMNAVIHALWVGEDQGPLILPSSIPLAAASVNAELTQYLQDSWKAVIDADVDGPNSEPTRIDTEKTLFGQRSMTKRLARTVFFGAAPTIGTAHTGIDTQRVFIGTAVPGDVVGNFHSALNQLADRATYFYSGAGKYWYDTQANITRRAKDAAESMHREDVWAEIVRRLQTQERSSGDFVGVHVGPADTGDIPDTDQARLVVLHPRYTHKKKSTESAGFVFARQATERRGTANRINRNMVVFLAPDEDRLAELESVVRTYLAWREIAAKSNELNLTAQQLAQANDKRDLAGKTANDRLQLAYHWVLNPSQPDSGAPFEIEEIKADGQAGSLAERVSKKLGSEGVYGVRHAARSVRLALENKVPAAWAKGRISVGELWVLYSQYPYMPRLRDRNVFVDALTNSPLLWQTDGFAVADSYDDATERYNGLRIPGDPGSVIISDATLIVKPEPAEQQRVAELKEIKDAPETSVSPTNVGQTSATSNHVSKPQSDPKPEPAVPTKIKRYVGSVDLQGDFYASDFVKVSSEVLANLAAAPGVNLRVRLSIDAVSSEGFDENQVRTIRENAATLKFSTNEFEAD